MTMSAAPAARTRSGSSALRIDSSAATGMSTSRRSAASSSRVAHGCSAYSSEYLPSARSMRAASSTDQPPFASTRIRPPGPAASSASRTAATRSTSSASRLPALGHLDLGGPAAGRGDDLVGALRPDGGHGHVDRHRVPQRRGPRHRRRLDRAGQPARRLGGPYSANGENSPHPAGPWISAPSRDGDPAELRPHRDGERPQRPEQLRQVTARHGAAARASRTRSMAPSTPPSQARLACGRRAAPAGRLALARA